MIEYIEKDRLVAPYTEEARRDFIIVNNRALNLKIETDEETGDLVALDLSEESKEEIAYERLQQLHVTRLDFINILEDLGLTWSNMKAIMAQYPEVEKELTMCSNVFRGNPLIDNMIPMVNQAFGLNITTIDLDNAFKNKVGLNDLE